MQSPNNTTNKKKPGPRKGSVNKKFSNTQQEYLNKLFQEINVQNPPYWNANKKQYEFMSLTMIQKLKIKEDLNLEPNQSQQFFARLRKKWAKDREKEKNANKIINALSNVKNELCQEKIKTLKLELENKKLKTQVEYYKANFTPKKCDNEGPESKKPKTAIINTFINENSKGNGIQLTRTEYAQKNEQPVNKLYHLNVKTTNKRSDSPSNLNRIQINLPSNRMNRISEKEGCNKILKDPEGMGNDSLIEQITPNDRGRVIARLNCEGGSIGS